MNKQCFRCLYNCKKENKLKVKKCRLNKLLEVKK